MSSIPRPGSVVEPKPWQTGLAPVYIGVFLWVAFFDQIGRRALPVGGLGWSLLGAAIAGPVGYLLLFRIPARWGRQVGGGLSVVSASTFGSKGSALVPGLLVGIGQVVVFAVAVGYAVDLTFHGLASLRLIDPRVLRPVDYGGATIKPPLVLATTLFWAVATTLVSFRFVRWIAYLMQFFPIFPGVLLGASMLAMLGGLRYFIPSGVDPVTSQVVTPEVGSPMAFLLTFQWVFAYGALAGLMGADWGAGSLTDRDVKIGGWLGMGLAPVVISALALIAIAGHRGSVEESRVADLSSSSRSTIQELTDPAGLPAAPVDTFRSVLSGGFDRRVSGLMMLVFGLASLAPAVYASFVFGDRFAAIGPGIPKLVWMLMGTFTAWLLIVGEWPDRPETIFNVLGAVFAPAAGAMAADYRRQRGVWPGPRAGINPAGLIAWSIGLAIGMAPILANLLGSGRLAQLRPAALAAFIAAYLAYEILGACRMESAPDPSARRASP
ncbi:purine-cytosine permease-like transporter [Tundrisphaera lichenicola]|uniref:purine-cytosine permease-like transporter n=1 Tax=Tundrisphaera lichenicola TaxID=2029860 RepID=UPI003EC07E33